MRWIYAPLLAVLASCGPSQTDIENVRQEERDRANQILQDQQNNMDAANAANAARDCAARETAMLAEHRQAIQNDRQTIMTTVGAVSGGGGDHAIEFGVRIETLDSSGWRWVEFENQAASSEGNVGAFGDRINYSVNPATLSSQVDLEDYSGLPAVRFRCNSGNCIRAIGRRVVYYNGENVLQDIDEGRSSNVWALDTANRAQVVRDALADLIGRGNNPPTAGNCAPAESNMQ